MKNQNLVVIARWGGGEDQTIIQCQSGCAKPVYQGAKPVYQGAKLVYQVSEPVHPMGKHSAMFVYYSQLKSILSCDLTK